MEPNEISHEWKILRTYRRDPQLDKLLQDSERDKGNGVETL